VEKNKRIRTNQNQQNQTFSTPTTTTTTNKQNKQQTTNKQITNKHKKQQLFFHHHLTGTPDVAGHGGDPAAQHLFNGHVHQVGLFHS